MALWYGQNLDVNLEEQRYHTTRVVNRDFHKTEAV